MLLRRYNHYPSSISPLLTGIQKLAQVGLIFPNAKVSPNTQIELRQTGLKFQVGGKMEICSLNEMVLDKVYKRHGIPVQDGWVAADNLGGIGNHTFIAASGHPAFGRAGRSGEGQPA